jgi:hypothetical protein
MKEVPLWAKFCCGTLVNFLHCPSLREARAVAAQSLRLWLEAEPKKRKATAAYLRLRIKQRH